MADSIRDLRFTFRLLAKSPGFTATAVLALALGIGANTAIFSVVYGNLLAPLPYTDPDHLVAIWSNVNSGRSQVAAADFLDWKRTASSFQQMAAFVEQPYNLSSNQEPQYIEAQRVSTNWYNLLEQKVWLGRDFRADEDQPGKDHVFLLSHRCWATRFGSDPNIIGQQFQLNGEPYTAIGVMAAGPSDRCQEEIWVPLRFSRGELSRGKRAVAVGRKNDRLAGSDSRGEHAATIYSLIALAKLNSLDPEAYLSAVLARIADHSINRIAELLP